LDIKNQEAIYRENVKRERGGGGGVAFCRVCLYFNFISAPIWSIIFTYLTGGRKLATSPKAD
jgi:hypothetical protein